MSGDLFWLALTAGLCLFIWFPYGMASASARGLKSATTDTPDVTVLPDWAKRLNRVHMNLLETLVPYATLVLILNISGRTDAAIVTATAIFFFSRIAHAVVYTLGIPFLRPATYIVGWAVCVYLLYRVVI